MDRKTFLLHSAKAAGISMIAPYVQHTLLDKPSPSLSILILGGTSFLGPHQIATALKRGHKVSTFTRGKTKPTVHQELFNDVESLIGDRKDNLEALKGRKWDVVIDNSGRNVDWTRETARLLKTSGLYMYTSSTGVYYPYIGDNITENTKLNMVVPEGISDYQKLEFGYGVMKTKSEIAAKKEFGEDRTIVVRPTYMMGPGDRTDRFTYWPIRLSLGGTIVVPGKADDPVQFVDVRDVADFMIHLAEMKSIGTFNTAGPASPTGMHAFVYGAQASFSAKSEFVFIDNHDFLKKEKLMDSVPWIMPTKDNYGSARVNFEQALKAGLEFRPLSESVRDIYDWWNTDVISKKRRTKLLYGERSLMAKEKELIKKWKRFSEKN